MGILPDRWGHSEIRQSYVVWQVFFSATEFSLLLDFLKNQFPLKNNNKNKTPQNTKSHSVLNMPSQYLS